MHSQPITNAEHPPHIEIHAENVHILGKNHEQDKLAFLVSIQSV